MVKFWLKKGLLRVFLLFSGLVGKKSKGKKSEGKNQKEKSQKKRVRKKKSQKEKNQKEKKSKAIKVKRKKIILRGKIQTPKKSTFFTFPRLFFYHSYFISLIVDSGILAKSSQRVKMFIKFLNLILSFVWMSYNFLNLKMTSLITL